MSWYSKVIWSEGLFLRPQHFQQQDRHAEWQLNARTAPLAANAWGFSRLELDEAALALGKIALARAAGILPDGTPFEFPLAQQQPLALDFPADLRDELVCLALPMRRTHAPELSTAESPDPLARYAIGEESHPDTTTNASAAEVLQTGEPRLQLALASRLSDAYVKLGVVRVVERRSDNSLLLDRGYVPPALSCSASPALASMLRDVQGLLRQRGDALAGRLTQAGSGGVSEIADFLFLLCVNRHQPLFDHLEGLEPLHPERLYAQMLALHGELATLVGESRRPAALPPYQQDALQACFDPLLREIRRALSAILEQNAIQIDLVDHKQGRYVGNIADRGLLRQAGFVLAVNARIPTELMRQRFPLQAKIGPVEKIRELVNLQLPGINMRPLPVAPRQIPFHAGYTYFELETSGDLWQQLENSGGLGIYVSGDFPGLEIALWAIKA